MTKNAIIAEALREIAEEQDEHHTLLMDIKRIVQTLADEQSEQRVHVQDGVSRLGTRVLKTEQRVSALELVVAGGTE
jgi:hypothetical protein